MTYELVFKQDALNEWRKLDSTIRTQFKKKLIERLNTELFEKYFQIYLSNFPKASTH